MHRRDRCSPARTPASTSSATPAQSSMGRGIAVPALYHHSITRWLSFSCALSCGPDGVSFPVHYHTRRAWCLLGLFGQSKMGRRLDAVAPNNHSVGTCSTCVVAVVVPPRARLAALVASYLIDRTQHWTNDHTDCGFWYWNWYVRERWCVYHGLPGTSYFRLDAYW